MKVMGNLKQILNKIFGIFGKNFENFWENFGLIISKIYFNFKIFYENFLEIRKKREFKNGRENL